MVTIPAYYATFAGSVTKAPFVLSGILTLDNDSGHFAAARWVRIMTKTWGVLIGTMLFANAVSAAEIEPIAAESRLEITQVKRQSVQLTSTIGGSVEALKTVSLAAQLPGRVAYIAGNEGDRFQAGALLLGLDNTSLRAKLQAAQAGYASAQAALRDAKAKLHREINSPSVVSKTPGGMGMPSMMDQVFMDPMQSMIGTRDTGVERQSDLVARQVGVSQAHSNLLRSQAQIQQIEAALRDSQSVAPFAGVIIKRHVELGDTVQSGQALLAFADTSRLEVKIEVPVRLRSALKEGMSLDVRLDDVANGRPVVKAVISRIFPVADSVRHTVPLELLLPEKSTAVAGMYAEVMIPESSNGAQGDLLIPRSAVVTKGGLPLVFVVDEKGQAMLRLLRLGAANNDSVVVISGLQEGASIVKQPRPGMKSGDSVVSNVVSKTE